jgi:hypothetical protein
VIRVWQLQLRILHQCTEQLVQNWVDGYGTYCLSGFYVRSFVLDDNDASGGTKHVVNPSNRLQQAKTEW